IFTVNCVFFFFFSSRRRHTRFSRDWSSDVCSSDLMLSLSNTYNTDELREFDERVKKSIGQSVAYVCELKFDGLSISLTYENGSLQQAVTRGDGVQGDVVTENVKTLRNIPHRLKEGSYPPVFEIRGEIFMHK